MTHGEGILQQLPHADDRRNFVRAANMSAVVVRIMDTATVHCCSGMLSLLALYTT